MFLFILNNGNSSAYYNKGTGENLFIVLQSYNYFYPIVNYYEF